MKSGIIFMNTTRETRVGDSCQ